VLPSASPTEPSVVDEDIGSSDSCKALETFRKIPETVWVELKMVQKGLYVGVSGFSYPGWKGNFYPKDLKSEDFLGYYSQRLNTVEINSSFYAPPTTAMIKAWSAKTQDNFLFSIKSPRQITHILKLGKGSGDSAKKLEATIELLGSKRGPILFQLPPFLRQDLKLLESFLEETNAVSKKVFEFRHESWLTQPTYALLEKYRTGFCTAETEDMKPVTKVIGNIAYFRLRLDSYDNKTIDNWSTKIKDLSKDVEETYVYLRHDENGENAALALRLRESVEQKS
jgi:uncharacterized protein YecE (DUF72 family)